MFLKKPTKSQQKQREIVTFINTQRKNGFKDCEIREKMEAYGHTPEMLNNYFRTADSEQLRQSSLKVFSFIFIILIAIVGAFFLAQQSWLTGAAITTVTGSATARGFLSGLFTTYECGDDYPADTDYIMDLTDCVNDEESTKNNLFCYLNNTISIDSISPNGSNDEWYLENLDIDLASLRDAGETTIDSMELFGASEVYPWNSEYDNVDCFEWNYGITRDEDWHLCNETQSDDELPSNLVFYFADFMADNTTDDGYVTTELYYNSSYYLCYDELNCTTTTSECDESAGWHCIGRLLNATEGVWQTCDTRQEAPYYRCCKSGCENPMEMVCGEYLEDSEGNIMDFEECSSDGTEGCCDDTTDCVYDGECYDLEETITYTYETLGVGGTDIEGTTTTYTFVCSDAHWCPRGFEYDAEDFICKPTQRACYDATDEDYCNYIYGVDDFDDYEADTGGSYPCIREDPDGVVSHEACVYYGAYGGVDFYFYQDIIGNT